MSGADRLDPVSLPGGGNVIAQLTECFSFRDCSWTQFNVVLYDSGLGIFFTDVREWCGLKKLARHRTRNSEEGSVVG